MLCFVGNRLWECWLSAMIIAVIMYAVHEYWNQFTLYNYLVTPNIMPVIKILEMVIDPTFLVLMLKICLGFELGWSPFVYIIVRSKCSSCWMMDVCFGCCISTCIQAILTNAVSVIGRALGIDEFGFSMLNTYTVIIFWFLLKNMYVFLPQDTPSKPITGVVKLLFWQFVLFGISKCLYDWSVVKFTVMSFFAFALFCMLSDEDGNRPACVAIETALGLHMDVKKTVLWIFHIQYCILLPHVLFFFMDAKQSFSVLVDNLTGNLEELQAVALLIKTACCQIWYTRLSRKTDK